VTARAVGLGGPAADKEEGGDGAPGGKVGHCKQARQTRAADRSETSRETSSRLTHPKNRVWVAIGNKLAMSASSHRAAWPC